MSYTLGLDASTQGCSAVIIDIETGIVAAEASVNFGRDLPHYNAPQGFIPGGPDGEVHTDPAMWLDALERLLSKLTADGFDLSRVQAISGAGQQHGSVYLNDRWAAQVASLDPSKSLSAQLVPCLARKTAPIWMDTSTGAECAEIAQAVGGDAVVCRKSGSIAIERFTGPQIRRFHKTAAKDYEATARIHLVSSFHASVLAGTDAPIDRGDGAGMNLLNLDAWDWDADLLAATAPGLREKLPPVVPSATGVGTIAPYFVEKYGFAEGTQVVAFTGDNNSSLVGMGASTPGTVVISLGTSDTFFAAMDADLTDPKGYGHVFGNPVGGRMTLQCFKNGSLAREKVKNPYGLDWDGFERALTEETEPGNDGNIMLPFFEPEISPRMDIHEPLLRGSEDFVTGRDPFAAIRACVEGQLVNMRLQSAWMQLETTELLLTGGASQSDGIAQVAADVFQSEVKRLAVSGSVALGAAMRAAQVALSADLGALEKAFCKPVPGSSLQPQPGTAQTYRELEASLQALL